MYMPPDIFEQAISDSVPHDTFACILRNLHLFENEQLDK